MRSSWPVFAIVLSVWGCGSPRDSADGRPVADSRSGKEIRFAAADGKAVYADFYASTKAGAASVVLMFHQAGSNANEYDAIAPKITSLGFDCIAVDQRSGGDMWGRDNRTVTKSGSGDYMAAYNDLLGTLKYAESKKYGKILVWGSSYSASLVLKLASENPSIAAVLAFSPGEYMDDKTVVGTWAKKVTQPVLLACTQDEWSDGRSDLFAKLASKDKISVVLPDGVHGSSTLIPEKSKAADAYMAKVQAFLKMQGGTG